MHLHEQPRKRLCTDNQSEHLLARKPRTLRCQEERRDSMSVVPCRLLFTHAMNNARVMHEIQTRETCTLRYI